MKYLNSYSEKKDPERWFKNDEISKSEK
jgi:hypothetical protein